MGDSVVPTRPSRPPCRSAVEIIASTVQSICAMGAVSAGIYIGKVDPTLGVGAVLAIAGIDIIGKKVAKIPPGSVAAIVAATWVVGALSPLA